MPTYNDPMRNIIADAIASELEGGDLSITKSDDTEIVNITLPADLYAAAASGTASFDDGSYTDGVEATITLAGTNAAAKFVATGSSGTPGTISGAVSTSGADINFNDVNFTQNDIARVTELDITQPAS